jgi:hypothetical protein
LHLKFVNILAAESLAKGDIFVAHVSSAGKEFFYIVKEENSIDSLQISAEAASELFWIPTVKYLSTLVVMKLYILFADV